MFTKFNCHRFIKSEVLFFVPVNQFILKVSKSICRQTQIDWIKTSSVIIEIEMGCDDWYVLHVGKALKKSTACLQMWADIPLAFFTKVLGVFAFLAIRSVNKWVQLTSIWCAVLGFALFLSLFGFHRNRQILSVEFCRFIYTFYFFHLLWVNKRYWVLFSL